MNGKWKRHFRASKNRANKRQEHRAIEAVMAGRVLATDDNGDGFVYVVKLGIDNLYKIGCAKNLKARVKSLMASNPNITVLFTAKVTSRRASEKALHVKFAAFRTQGEIFALDQAEIDEMASSFFPDAREPRSLDGFFVSRPETGGIKCSGCGKTFLPLKAYWRLCDACIKGSHNRTESGWQRWRNLRAETHLYEDREKS